MKLPPDNLLAFYRRLLELNLKGRGHFAIGVTYDIVAVCATRAIEGLADGGFIDVTAEVGQAADFLDDYLHEEFGAPFYEPEEE